MRPILLALTLVHAIPMCAVAQVSGTVIADADGSPIAGAIVTLQATDTRATTDAAGRFELVGVSAAEVVVVGAGQGFFNASASVTAPATGVTIRLEAIPVEDSAAHVFASPADCGSCHPTQLFEWRGSAMSHAGTNTWVHDIYDGSGTAGGEGGFVYTRDSVHAAANPASECAACHQPLSWIPAPFSPMAPRSAPTSAVQDGVSCVVCHQIASIDITRPNAPGIFPDVVRMTRTADSSAVMYGLLGDVDFEVAGRMRAAYNPQLAADVCAACHQDANDPDGDHDYDEAGSVISEPTYLEWLDSDYADPTSPRFATCIDCHMLDSTPGNACNQALPYSRPPGQQRSHSIEGTTATFLENAVSLELSTRREGASLSVDVTVTNDQTGHHVPTGVTIRNMVLLVEATVDGVALEHTGSQVLHDLAGVGDPAMGYYAGLPGKLYAKFNQAADGTSPTFFTDAVSIIEDNRIAPLASDATSYTFSVPTGAAEIEVRARLIYRRSWRALLDAKGWTEDGHGVAVEDLAAPHFGHLMEEAEQTVSMGLTDGGLTDGGPMDAGGGVADSGTEPVTDGGCGCRVAPDAPLRWPWLLAALMALAYRRRRATL